MARLRLVRIICTNILQKKPDEHITAQIYGKWAQEIVRLFPKERITVYFFNKIVNSGRGIVNRLAGKLPDQIHNLKRKYRKTGVIYHCEGQEILEKRLERKLVAEGVSPDLVGNILASIFKEDPFVQSSNKLKSNFRRKKFYNKNFDYVEPVSLFLTESHEKNAKYFQYVPILKTVEHFFRDKSVQEELLKDPKPREDEVLRDFTDGNVYKKNAFFKQNINDSACSFSWKLWK